ncbi:hypothetical protein CFC21_084353 [Triticum aestivum]|uniref:non-specific serine/threonine protein kinase n=2 Tax=Triticum aestivum TaxID=4565 RepID=A0A3B6NRV9_WHEAT|nr:cysteine-rich receptor-like protein kinase 10 [Triticum aestivum]KAF7080247.1 hypothetical protein CFC21_084353 [Triticum aestivum]
MASLLLTILGFLLTPLSATATVICSNGGNYTANSAYQSNLAVLAATLPINASTLNQTRIYFYATATAGGAPDVVYALALCRGDMVNATACRDCVAASFQDAQQRCPYDRGATVYMDDDAEHECHLSYSSDNLLSPANITENGTLFQEWNQQIIPGDAAIVAAGVRDLLNGTALDAAIRPMHFATAFMDSISTSGATTTLYSLAQCTPDLFSDNCQACLQRLVGMVNATMSVRLGGRIVVLRCNIRFEANLFYKGQPMRRITPSSIAPVPAPADKNHGTKPWVVAISVVAPVVLVAFCFIVYCHRLRRRGRKGKGGLRRKRGGDELWEIETELSEFSVFDFQQILQATNNFSEENKLGEGGFGPVYKGYFPEGMEKAVKRLASQSGQGFTEFKNEVELIAKLQHRNLVRLLGCCSQGEEKILVYEYLPNKSLDLFIFGEDGKSLMDWNRRLTIVEGIAEGLLYLHKHSRLRVIHRDLKPSNILLDNEMNPKISDFGLAKIFSPNNTEGDTTRVVGTYGYMAPEYSSLGIFSIKSDVFSFGVLVLEILSGQRNSGSRRYGDFINLTGYAWQLWDEGRWFEVVEESLLPTCQSEEIVRCINIALLCVQEKAANRPTMLDVIAMLSNKDMILGEPKHPAYFNLRVGNEEASSTSTQWCSVNDVTISVITPR